MAAAPVTAATMFLRGLVLSLRTWREVMGNQLGLF